jgi:hypothetical protein
VGASVTGSISITRDDVGNPTRARSAECISRYTSPGAPSTVMVDITRVTAVA